MNKAPDAFRTISEVADDLDIPQHVLRFWETRFSAIRPLKRGGGRRYYRPDDIDLLRGIRHLLYGQGYTIKGVQRILKDQGPRAVQGIGRGDDAPVSSSQPSDRDSPKDIWPAGRFHPEAEQGGEFLEAEPPPDLIPPPADERPTDVPHRRLALTAPGLAADQVQRLRGALADLMECRRVLDALKRR